MFRSTLPGMSLAVLLALSGGALAQGATALPTMPHPPSFNDPVPPEGKAKKGARKPAKAGGRASSAAGAPNSYERPNKFVPAEFDRERGGSGAGAGPMLSGSGRPGMGMKF